GLVLARPRHNQRHGHNSSAADMLQHVPPVLRFRQKKAGDRNNPPHRLLYYIGKQPVDEGNPVVRNRFGAFQDHFRMLFAVGAASGYTDGQVLEQFTTRRGEAAELAFAALVERHGPMVLLACRDILGDDHEAQDAFQATFLILVRKAGSLWVRDSIGPWLHRVACRVAVRARIGADRRRAVERQAVEAAARLTARSPHDEEWAGLHEEIDRLPERYRGPIVLCYL